MPKHLPNLDTLRGLAAILVLFYHVDLALVMNGYKAHHIEVFPFGFGARAVEFFFVLSGFLITYLLLHEKERQPISIRNFYLKRVLRIWPLYYLLLLVSFLLLNNHPLFQWTGVTTNIQIDKHPLAYALLLLAICPNLVMVNSPAIGYANPTWSIGVEEQFYILWPWIVRSRHALKIILSIILSLYLLSHGLIGKVSAALPEGSTLWSASHALNKFFTFDYSFRIDAMAIGALGAYAVFKRASILKPIFSRSFQLFLYLLILPLLIYPHLVDYQFYCVAFCLLIMNMACNPKNLLNVGNPVMDYLGRISYGVYLLHNITIMPAIFLVIKKAGIPYSFGAELLILAISFTATAGIASLSHFTFERFFLQLKTRNKRNAQKPLIVAPLQRS